MNKKNEDLSVFIFFAYVISLVNTKAMSALNLTKHSIDFAFCFAYNFHC
jgi:hypothetical protein